MITVFGSINVDLVCRVRKIPLPGETVIGSDYALIPGGKGANQALAARRAGAEVRLVGAIGDDDIGKVALDELIPGGVDLTAVARRKGTTGVAIITVDDSGENTIVRLARRQCRRECGTDSAGRPVPARHAPPPDGGAARRGLRCGEGGARPVGRGWCFRSRPSRRSIPAVLGDIDVIIVNEHEAEDFARHLGLPTGGAEATVAALAERLGRTVIATLGPGGGRRGGRRGRDPGAGAAGDRRSTRPAPATPSPGCLPRFSTRAATSGPRWPLRRSRAPSPAPKHGAQPSFPTRAEIEEAAIV